MKNIRVYIAQILISVGFLALATLSTPMYGSVAYAQGACGSVETSIIDCDSQLGGEDVEGSHIFGLIEMVMSIMTAGVGIVAVGGIVYGGLLYASAGDKADQVQKSIGVIKNVVIGLIAYAVLFAFVQYLIPGGVF